MEGHTTPEMDMETTCPVDQSSEEFQLLVAYCDRRKKQWSGTMAETQGFSLPPASAAIHMSHEHFMFKGAKLDLEDQTYRIFKQGPSLSSDFPGPVGRRQKKKKVVEKGAAGDDAPTCNIVSDVAESEGSLSGVADRLTQIADTVKISPVYVLKSCSTDNFKTDETLDNNADVIRKLVELLKVSGDVLDEEIKRNPILQKHFQTSFNYGMFEKLTTILLRAKREGGPELSHVGPASEESVQKEQIALAFEVTSRLSALDLHPMNRAMGFGLRYLQQHFTAWVKKQGGWNKAFDCEDCD
ncbi:hypothetical protein DPEC_G00162200 [Dallia pectoralis]|uniref:Uncharacterized protein n=1 Tax=Dallia pectoralis TaxID=75939 RepID=A0ACC2GGV4_DALPE|nr:hypothetical protein DPEC_G00162200 [Dallia pectoralis]